MLLEFFFSIISFAGFCSNYYLLLSTYSFSIMLAIINLCSRLNLHKMVSCKEALLPVYALSEKVGSLYCLNIVTQRISILSTDAVYTASCLMLHTLIHVRLTVTALVLLNN